MPRLLVNGRFLGQRLTGVQRYGRVMLEALAGLDAEGWTLGVAGDTSALSGPLAARVERLDDRSPLGGALWEQVRLPAWFRRWNADVLWCPGFTGPLGLPRQAVSLHDTSVFEEARWYTAAFGAWYRWLLPRLARSAARVVVPSRFVHDEALRRRLVASERLRLVVPPVAPRLHAGAPPRTAMPAMAGPPAPAASRAPARAMAEILYVGSTNPRKNLARLLRAWERVHRERPDAALRLVLTREGRGEAPGALRGRPGVVVETRLSDDALAAAYATATVLVLPSLHEGFGFTAAEAMACGTPVVAARATALPETCGEAARYCDPLDEASIAAALLEVLHDGTLRETLSHRGLERARDFDPPRAAAALLGVLDEARRA